MRNAIIFGLSLIAFIWTSGCANFIYRTSDINENLNRAVHDYGNFSNQARMDYKNKKDTYFFLINSGANPTDPPYPALKADLKEMNKYLSKMYTGALDLKSKQIEIQKALANKSKITTKDPAWSKVEDFKNYSQSLQKNAKSWADKYSRASSQFVARTTEFGIREINAAELKDRVNGYITKSKSQISAIEAHMTTARNQIQQLPVESWTKKRLTLKEMSEIFEEIQKNNNEFIAQVNIVENELKGKNKILVAPHMTSHSILKNAETTGKKLDLLSGRFNTLGKILNE